MRRSFLLYSNFLKFKKDKTWLKKFEFSKNMSLVKNYKDFDLLLPLSSQYSCKMVKNLTWKQWQPDMRHVFLNSRLQKHMTAKPPKASDTDTAQAFTVSKLTQLLGFYQHWAQQLPWFNTDVQQANKQEWNDELDHFVIRDSVAHIVDMQNVWYATKLVNSSLHIAKICLNKKENCFLGSYRLRV